MMPPQIWLAREILMRKIEKGEKHPSLPIWYAWLILVVPALLFWGSLVWFVVDLITGTN